MILKRENIVMPSEIRQQLSPNSRVSGPTRRKRKVVYLGEKLRNMNEEYSLIILQQIKNNLYHILT